MPRKAGIGIQSFEKIIRIHNFYVDKTLFIKEWWENHDEVTLITRPRRFGKTLNMSMLECFFSAEYAGRGELFEGLHIWTEECYRALQGTYPVISLSFANVKETTYEKAKIQIFQILSELYTKRQYLKDSGHLTEKEQMYFDRVSEQMSDTDASICLHRLCDFMQRYYGKKVIVLLDEYDTPMQEAFLNGYWNEIVSFMKNLLHTTFKTNPFLEKAILTGITKVGKESIFSDLNNLEVVTSIVDKYTDAFGFTQAEVTDALREFGLSHMEDRVRSWYDGFTFGKRTDIYNPWSMINFLDKQRLATYWANTSSNSMISKLIREGSKDMKIIMEDLLEGGVLRTRIDEQIVFDQLLDNEYAIWSLLLASGYLNIESCNFDPDTGWYEYELKLTNKEVTIMFRSLIESWFKNYSPAYNDFIKALLCGDLKAMNHYMNQVALDTFSYFDTGNKPSAYAQPERFYHGFVLGLMVELRDRYVILSNRESGFGRYDILLKPKHPNGLLHAIMIEFKVQDTQEEETIQDTVQAALSQIMEKQYAVSLEAEGIAADRIKMYGFAFQGKKVLIGSYPETRAKET